MSQAFLTNPRPTVDAGPLLVRVRRERLRSIDSRATRQQNSNRTAPLYQHNKEWALIQQAIAGNADAHEVLFARHTNRLYRIAFALLRNKEDAEDAIQDGFCKAYTSLHSFQGRSSFSTWLTRIVINAALMIRRRNNAHPEVSLDEISQYEPDGLSHTPRDARPNPEKLCALIEVNALVEKQVQKLTPGLQAAFRLRVIDGFSAAESSLTLGLPANAIKARIYQARRKLARALQRIAVGDSGAKSDLRCHLRS